MIAFENPAAFLWLLLLPILFFLRALKIFVPLTLPLVLGDWHGKYFSWKKNLRYFVSVLVTLLALLAFVFAIIAAAEPVVHHQEKVYSSRGSDILFVLDTSPSMAAQDIGTGNRIQAAKQAIRMLVQNNTGASVGLVEMARDAALVVPPTIDRSLFLNKLDSIVVGELGDGTAIGIGLSCAIFHLESSSAPKKTIVLITDGENNYGAIHPFTAAHLAKEKNISLYILGLGTNDTVPLEYVDPKTGRVYSGFLESHYDSAAVAQIALEANGKFFQIENMSSLIQALDSVSKNEGVVQSYQIKNTDKKYNSVFIFIAGILILIAIFLKRICLQEVL